MTTVNTGGSNAQNGATTNVKMYPFNETDPSKYMQNPDLPWRKTPPKLANTINLDPNLSAALGAINKEQSGNIGNVYGGMRTQFSQDAVPHKAQPGGYADRRLTATEALSNQNLMGSLGAVSGDQAYTDYKAQRDFENNMALAKLTGELNKPSTLEQVLGGLSGGAQMGGQGYALYQSMNKAPEKKKTNGVLPSYQQNNSSGYPVPSNSSIDPSYFPTNSSYSVASKPWYE